ncbi:surface protease GP63 [Trypanosoma theileri]|uniref:Leishmanolysin-like peptidase n=1 Tax=Trypanosoma theileri TaxID=67003 RepID=A0A1X0NPU7_9TRYP|nr:surface protease GP63 [Trypanosoma theileri]ORC86548.1 surface protease GP63 [Trypanosoma theileri]
MRCIPHTVVLLLCCTIACFASAEHRCIFDKIARKAGTPTTVVVREVPHQRSSGEQAMAISSSTWETMRFRVFTEDIENSSRYCTSASDVRPDFTGDIVQCTEGDVLTSAMRSAIMDRLIPQAVQMHVDRLHVLRTGGNIVVPTYTGLCGEFTIPSDHHTVGVSNADMVSYAAAGPTSGSTLAWATTCSALIIGRPVVGVMNFGAQVATDTEHNVRVATHEIAHALGFSIDALMVHTSLVAMPGLRGKNSVLVVASPRTLEKTRANFNCSTAPGMELEDEGGSGTALSHWGRRNAKDHGILLSLLERRREEQSRTVTSDFLAHGFF